MISFLTSSLCVLLLAQNLGMKIVSGRRVHHSHTPTALTPEPVLPTTQAVVQLGGLQDVAQVFYDDIGNPVKLADGRYRNAVNAIDGNIEDVNTLLNVGLDGLQLPYPAYSQLGLPLGEPFESSLEYNLLSRPSNSLHPLIHSETPVGGTLANSLYNRHHYLSSSLYPASTTVPVGGALMNSFSLNRLPRPCISSHLMSPAADTTLLHSQLLHPFTTAYQFPRTVQPNLPGTSSYNLWSGTLLPYGRRPLYDHEYVGTAF